MSSRIAPPRPLFDFSLIVLTLGVAAFMAGAANYYSVFDDEAFSCCRYVLPAREIVAALWNHVEPDPPLYYLAAHGWMSLFGVSPLAMRSLSIACFIVGVVCLGHAGRDWFGPTAGRWVVILTLLHPLHLFFGFAARWYSMMFLWTAVLLLATVKLQSSVASSRKRWNAVWILAAAAACYTNYFAPVVVGLLLSANTITGPNRRAWLLRGVAAALLFSPWLPAFFGQLGRFPQIGGSLKTYAVAAARPLVALCTGNLADPGGISREAPGAWWVWLPISVFFILLVACAWTRRNMLLPLLIVCVGSLVAGVATRTLIDKYVMTFSAATCLLVVGALVGTDRARRAAALALCIAWAGCYVNMVRQRDWTSQRWLDPFATMTQDLAARAEPADRIVASHPCVGYYWGLRAVRSASAADPQSTWAEHAAQVLPPSPDLARALLQLATPPRVWLIETASTAADDEVRRQFVNALAGQYEETARGQYAPDPAAERKNRMDPAYQHPAHRMVVRLLTPIRPSQDFPSKP